MIVQRASAGEKAFVITMDEHTAFAGELARAFGNDNFQPVEPRDLMLYVIDHHDAGWKDLDAEAPCDPDTGLPYHLVRTPIERILETSSASPDFNSRRHPYCGLISSMHSWGLYNGRYGMSEMVLLDKLAAENRTMAETMLNAELSRQEKLKKQLEASPQTRAWIDETHLFQNYKQLQFFDTLALYFNCTPEDERAEATFTHVPRNASDDTEVQVRPVGDSSYSFSPFPFAKKGVEMSFSGRYLTPHPRSEILAEELRSTPKVQQVVRLVA